MAHRTAPPFPQLQAETSDYDHRISHSPIDTAYLPHTGDHDSQQASEGRHSTQHPIPGDKTSPVTSSGARATLVRPSMRVIGSAFPGSWSRSGRDVAGGWHRGGTAAR